ncbi:hypothetical protein CYMTET_39835 [Cymbomonas tetramitiformis]|uniref:Palmitoyl-protein thioesterase 1 n=1 Tax=Cymbomonas tetramitiformis TaxID=36881 RepID=A0AAE0C9A4_9CHLO|nr:hypothetical protein CYMTET_39835 [Cymbomonas tetramitiformis]
MSPENAKKLPHLNAFLERAHQDPAGLARHLHQSSNATIANDVTVGTKKANAADTLPVVVAHGMGDSCFNSGMKSITEASGNRLGVYATCIPTADNWITDTIGGFLKNMDKSVEYFAKRVRADPKLKNGFNAFGLSQGNNVIRGYITKYNDPPVHTFMSICGINAGVGAFPECSPSTPVVGSVCSAITEVLGDLAYLEIAQDILFQADYFRDPKKVCFQSVKSTRRRRRVPAGLMRTEPGQKPVVAGVNVVDKSGA